MQKSIPSILSIILLFLLVLSSCELLPGGDEEPGAVDLSVVSVEPLMDGTEVVGVRVTIQNDGDSEESVLVSIFLSEDTILSTVNDDLVYEETVSVTANREKVMDYSTETQIDPYMQEHSVSLDAGDYYIGVKLDRNDDIAEDSETNNEAVSSETFPIEPNYIDGTVTFGVTNAAEYAGETVYFAVMPYYEEDNGGDDGFLALGTFVIDTSGDGSALAQTFDTAGNLTGTWTGTGGEDYSIGWLIDFGDDFSPTTGPGPGDLMGDLEFLITPLNGNESMTADFDDLHMYPHGAVVGMLDGMTEAVGGEVAFFIAVDGTEINSVEDITVLGTATVDSAGDAFTILSDVVAPGFPNVSGDPFYPELSTTYMTAAVIDMHGDGYAANGNIYNIPGDYTDAAFSGDETSDQDTFTYEGDSEWIVKYSVEHDVYDKLVLISGIVITLSNFTDYFGVEDIGFNLYSSDRNQDEGTTILSATVDSSANKRVVYMGNNDGFPRSPDEGNYDLTVFIDTDQDGVLDAGEEALTTGLYYNGDGSGEYGITVYGSELEPWADPVIDSEAGIYSESHEIQVAPDISEENIYLDDIATGGVGDPSPYDGSVYLVVNFFETSTTEPSWLHFNFNPALQIDSAITHVNFHMNRARDGGATALSYTIWDGSGNMGGGVNIYDYLAVDDNPDDDWEVFSVPLLGTTGTVDRSDITSIGIGNPTDDFGYCQCSYDIDDLYFGTELTRP